LSWIFPVISFGKKFFGAAASFDALRNAAYTAAKNLLLEKLPC
jgi:hypothetical protein